MTSSQRLTNESNNTFINLSQLINKSMTQSIIKQFQRQPLVALVVFFLTAFSVRTSLNYNCNSSDNTALDNGEAVWKIGDASTLCVYFLPYQVKVAFKVTVDKNVALSLRNGYEVFKTGDTDVAVQLSSSTNHTQQIVISLAIHSQVCQKSLSDILSRYSTGERKGRYHHRRGSQRSLFRNRQNRDFA